MDSPFKCGGVKKDFAAIPPGMKLVIRIDKTSGAILYVKKNGTPSATAHDYRLFEGDFLEVVDRSAIVTVLNTGADPDIIWTFEPIAAHRP